MAKVGSMSSTSNYPPGERNADGMLTDGSNPEGVDPVPALGWSSSSDIKDVVVHGPMFSTGTTKVRTALVFAKISHKHETHMVVKGKENQGMKPGTPYQKCPVMDASGRQVNDSMIIFKSLFPAIGLPIDEEWEKKITLGLDTSVKIQATAADWAALFTATILNKGDAPFPGCLACILVPNVVGPKMVKVEREQGEFNIKNSGCGHYKVPIEEWAKEFAAARKGVFFGGEKPAHPDVSLYGYLAGFIYAQAPIADKFISAGGLEDWLAAMQKEIPIDNCFVKGGFSA